MRLDEIPFSSSGYRQVLPLPNGTYVDIWEEEGDRGEKKYTIYHDRTPDNDSVRSSIEYWEDLDPIAAQAILYHLFSLT
jgi:hypothetical protein